MGRTFFNGWLRNPSTTRLLPSPACSTSCRPSYRSYDATGYRHRAPTFFVPLSAKEDGDGIRESHGYYRNARRTIPKKSDASAETLLRISLLTGEHLAASHVHPDQAFQALSTQADVQLSQINSRRLVDKQEHWHNIKLWVELLNYRHRLDGLNGVKDVWQGMRSRHVDLPFEGEDAHALWSSFVNACIANPSTDEHESFLVEIVGYAKSLYARTGRQYSGLYSCIIGGLLRINLVNTARLWHQLLVEVVDPAHIDLRTLAEVFATDGALKRFRIIYEDFEQTGLYDYYIPALLERHGPEKVLKWHKYFLRRGDAPSAQNFNLPLVQTLFELDGNKSLPMMHQRPTPDATARPVLRADQTPALTRPYMSTIVGEVHGIQPKEMSDSFVAKMFATRAFTLDMVIHGLSFFGIEKLGPLAIREMATRADTPVEFCNKLSALKHSGISIDSSVYGRLLEKVSKEYPNLYEVLITSDEHPEVFEESKTQESLLQSFLERGDKANAHLAFMALSLIGQFENERAWNRVLQHHICAQEYQTVSKLVEQMKASKLALTKRTLTFMHVHLLPRRNPGHAPPNYMPEGSVGVPPLQFVTNAYIYAAECGIAVDEKFWREIMKRFGMLARWEELERLVVWFVGFYSKRGRQGGVLRSHGKAYLRSTSTLEDVLNEHMRKALVFWGFRTAGWRKVLRIRDGPSKEACEPWARGIYLLKQLGESGLETDPAIVKDAFLGRMWILFGPAWSAKGINQDVKRDNDLSLAHYVRHANELWDGKLFELDPTLYEPRNHAALLVAVFGNTRRVSIKRREVADVVAYARALEHGKQQPDSRNSFRRQQYWNRSPFRLLKGRPRHSLNHASSDLLDPPRPPRHQSPPAHSWSSYQPPNPQDTQEPASPCSPLQQPALPASYMSAPPQPTSSPQPQDSANQTSHHSALQPSSSPKQSQS